MRKFYFGETLAVTYPNNRHRAGLFVVAKDPKGWPYLICYNSNGELRTLSDTENALTQGDGFLVEGVPFKVDNDDFALSVGQVTGTEAANIIRAA